VTSRSTGSVWKHALAVLWICGAGIVARGPYLAAQDPGEGYGAGVGDLAPPVVVTDLDGAGIDIGSYFGRRPVLILFWATWCERCEALMPALRAAYQRYRGDVEFFGINVAVNQPIGRVRRFVEEVEPPYRALYDAAGVSQRAFRVPTTSYVVIVGPTGRIAYIGLGAEQDLESALAEATESTRSSEGADSGS